jgi:hypothetical protein
LQAIVQHQVEVSHGRIHGEAVEVPVLEAPGQTRIGRFGWKDQHSSLLSFIGDAYLNEMGVTNRLRPKDVTTVGKVTSDPEDVPDDIGLADIDHFAQFVRGTKAPRPQHTQDNKSSRILAAPVVMSAPSLPLPLEQLSMAERLPYLTPWAIRSSTLTVTFCFTTSRPETVSSKTLRKTQPTNCAQCRCGGCACTLATCTT